jgi:hypothetical protein
MRNWRTFVREHLPQRGTRRDPEEVVSELAAHLEEVYEAARSRALSDSAALDLTLQEVNDWDALAKRICRAKSTEGSMSQPTKLFFLPAMATLFAGGLILVLLDRAAILQRLIWIGCMAMLLCTAACGANRLNHRTRLFWLPGFVSMPAATIFLFAADIVYDPPSSSGKSACARRISFGGVTHRHARSTSYGCSRRRDLEPWVPTSQAVPAEPARHRSWPGLFPQRCLSELCRVDSHHLADFGQSRQFGLSVLCGLDNARLGRGASNPSARGCVAVPG